MAVERHRFITLMIIPAYARAGVFFGIRYLQYGRPEGGTGTDFFKSPPPLSSLRWLLLPIFISIFLGKMCLVINGVFFGMTLMIILFYKRRMNCITGDMLGAMVEVMEATLFLTMVVVW